MKKKSVFLIVTVSIVMLFLAAFMSMPVFAETVQTAEAVTTESVATETEAEESNALSSKAFEFSLRKLTIS